MRDRQKYVPGNGLDPVGLVGRAGRGGGDNMGIYPNVSPPRGPMFQNDRTNFLWPVLQYLKPQYVTDTTQPVVRSPPLLFTRGNKSKHRHRRMRDYIGSLGEAGIFFFLRNTRKKKQKNCDAADFLFLHLYLFYISSTLNDVIGLRHQSLNLEVFFSPKPLSLLVRTILLDCVIKASFRPFGVDQLCPPNVLAFAHQRALSTPSLQVTLSKPTLRTRGPWS